MVTTADFKGFGLAILDSQQEEITLGRQPILAEHGASVRQAINKLPPEASNELLAEYGTPSLNLIKSLETSIVEREFVVDNMQSVELDSTLVEQNRRMDEVGLSDGDSWNDGPGM